MPEHRHTEEELDSFVVFELVSMSSRTAHLLTHSLTHFRPEVTYSLGTTTGTEGSSRILNDRQRQEEKAPYAVDERPKRPIETGKGKTSSPFISLSNHAP